MWGTVNQLPSVGPGSVLKDMIEIRMIFLLCGSIRFSARLGESDIVVNAHKINNGEPVELKNKGRDFFFLKRQDANVIISIVIQLVKEKMPKYVDAPMHEIQVLTPMKKD